MIDLAMYKYEFSNSINLRRLSSQIFINFFDATIALYLPNSKI